MSDSLDRLKAALADHYVIEGEIGTGGMATVYVATDLRHQRRVALKVLRPDLAAGLGVERFLQEVRVTANLQHPHILPLFDSGQADGFLYFVLPYVEGESLRQRLSRERELPVPEAARLLRDVVDALAAAHAKGVVHRDVKPENVMLSGHHAMVTDFGVAKAVSEATGRHRLTTTGVALGTPAYMAPEQAAADTGVDHRADIYAVGVLAYELLTGRPPFSGATPQQILTAQVMEAPKPVHELRPAVPPALEALVMRCLQKNPADRWQSAEELLLHLEAVMTPSGGMTPTGLEAVGGRPPKRAALLPWISAAVVMGLVAVAAMWWEARTGSAGNEPSGAAATAAAPEDEPDRLVVMPLENLTGDTAVDVWAQLAAEWMGRAIDEPRPVAVIPASSVRDVLRLLGDTATVTAVARRLKADYALTGTVARTGGTMRFQVEFLDVRTGERLRSLEPVVGSADSVDVVVGRLAQAASGAAVSLLDPSAPPWLGSFSVPPSVETYRDVLEQSRLFCQSRYAEATEVGNRVLRQSPDFVPALVLNAYASGNRGLGSALDSILGLLDPLRPSMTSTERLSFDFLAAWRDGDLLKRTRAAEEAFRIDPSMWAYNAGNMALRTNHLERAVTRFLAADPDSPCNVDWKPWWTQLASTYHLLGRYEDELDLARRGLARYPAYFGLLDVETRALAALGRVEEVDSLLDLVAGLPPAQGYVPGLRPLWAALELRVHGHPEAAQRATDRALAWFAGLPSDTLRYQRGRGFFYAGRLEDADTLFAALQREAPGNLLYLGFHGVTLARLHRREEARKLDERLAAWDEPAELGSANEFRAQIAAALGERDEAVRLLQAAFDHGAYYGVPLHLEPAFEGMKGYPPWEALVAPRP